MPFVLILLFKRLNFKYVSEKTRYPSVHKTHNGHACMLPKIYKRVHVSVYSSCLVFGYYNEWTMLFPKRLIEGFKK